MLPTLSVREPMFYVNLAGRNFMEGDALGNGFNLYNADVSKVKSKAKKFGTVLVKKDSDLSDKIFAKKKSCVRVKLPKKAIYTMDNCSSEKTHKKVGVDKFKQLITLIEKKDLKNPQIFEKNQQALIENPEFILYYFGKKIKDPWLCYKMWMLCNNIYINPPVNILNKTKQEEIRLSNFWLKNKFGKEGTQDNLLYYMAGVLITDRISKYKNVIFQDKELIKQKALELGKTHEFEGDTLWRSILFSIANSEDIKKDWLDIASPYYKNLAAYECEKIENIKGAKCCNFYGLQPSVTKYNYFSQCFFKGKSKTDNDNNYFDNSITLTSVPHLLREYSFNGFEHKPNMDVTFMSNDVKLKNDVDNDITGYNLFSVAKDAVPKIEEQKSINNNCKVTIDAVVLKNESKLSEAEVAFRFLIENIENPKACFHLWFFYNKPAAGKSKGEYLPDKWFRDAFAFYCKRRFDLFVINAVAAIFMIDDINKLQVRESLAILHAAALSRKMEKICGKLYKKNSEILIQQIKYMYGCLFEDLKETIKGRGKVDLASRGKNKSVITYADVNGGNYEVLTDSKSQVNKDPNQAFKDENNKKMIELKKKCESEKDEQNKKILQKQIHNFTEQLSEANKTKVIKNDSFSPRYKPVYCNFAGLSFEGVELTGTGLQGANLFGASFSKNKLVQYLDLRDVMFGNEKDFTLSALMQQSIKETYKGFYNIYYAKLKKKLSNSIVAKDSLDIDEVFRYFFFNIQRNKLINPYRQSDWKNSKNGPIHWFKEGFVSFKEFVRSSNEIKGKPFSYSDDYGRSMIIKSYLVDKINHYYNSTSAKKEEPFLAFFRMLTGILAIEDINEISNFLRKQDKEELKLLLLTFGAMAFVVHDDCFKPACIKVDGVENDFVSIRQSCPTFLMMCFSAVKTLNFLFRDEYNSYFSSDHTDFITSTDFCVMDQKSGDFYKEQKPYVNRGCKKNTVLEEEKGKGKQKIK